MNINEQFIINLQGKSYVTYEGLLDLAHQNNLISMEVDIIQIPSPDNNMTAICKATARTKDKLYTDLGDASPSSVTRNLVPHIIRMASTRAKARVLRDLTNVGMTAIEELDGVDNGQESSPQGRDPNTEAPTKRQLDTLKKLSETLKITIEYSDLNKESARILISNLIDKANKQN